MSLKITEENITPAIAKRMLAKNQNNRPLNQLTVLAYAKDMKNKIWNLTGEAIKFDINDNLIDGQHRLHGVVEANETAKFVVIRGLQPEVFKSLDTGRTRKPSDVLSIEGVANAVNIAAIIRFIISFKRGNYNPASTLNRGSFKITNTMISDYASKHIKSLKDSYDFGYGKGNTKGRKLVNGTLAGGMHYVLKAISEPEADDFFNRLIEGTGLTKTSPIFQLRERFINDGLNKSKMSMSERIALHIPAWNLYRQSKPAARLVFNKNEDFPKAA